LNFSKKFKKRIFHRIFLEIFQGIFLFGQPITGCHVAGSEAATWPRMMSSYPMGAYVKLLALASFEHGTSHTSMDSLTNGPALWVVI